MSLKKNFVYSSILTVSSYLFPLIVYPYVSRTLGLSNIGIVNFIDNLIYYFILISMMGITTVGVREIAATKCHPEKLSKTFMSLLSLTAIMTLIAIVILWIAMYTVSVLFPYRDMLYVGIIKLILNLFVIEWFFTGMEEFQYITNRSIFIKIVYAACVFLFIKEASDYKLYYILSVAMVGLNATVNIAYCTKFVRFTLKAINFRPYLKAFLIMGLYLLLTNVYTYLNPVWLGFVTNTDEVGYFTTATKLHTLIMAVLWSLSNILFPRVSNLLAEGKETEFWNKINTSFEAIFLFAFPTIVYLLVAGPELLHLIVGDGFEGAYLPLRIITPLVLIIGIEQILVIQILMALHNDSLVLLNSFIGALVAFLLNVLITGYLGSLGSAIVWLVSENVVMVLSILAIYRKYNYSMPYKRVCSYCIAYIPLLITSILIYTYLGNSFLMLVIVAAWVAFYTVLNEMFILKNKVFLLLLNTLYSRLKV